jgi:peroxiredoxin
MTAPERPSRARFFAMLMIGSGLVIFGVALFVFLRNSAPASASELSMAPVEVNYAAPKLNLVDMAGNKVSLGDYAGSVVLVNLWATWCPPCKQELPALQSFYEKHRVDGFVLLGIDQEETLEVVQPFVADFGLTFPIWLDENYMAQRVFNTMSLPSSFVIDRSGTVCLMWVGAVSEEFLEKHVTKIIKE